MVEIDDTKIRPFEWLTSSDSVQPLIESLKLSGEKKKCLHVGCGSSTLGEVLVDSLDFDFVLNIDKDPEILERMEQRWANNNKNDDRNVYQCVDFMDHATILKESPFPLILDKSTLDCTLCSTDATTGLLSLVYHNLQEGGYYVIISFHSLQLLLPLLSELPGTNWTVTHQTMTRHVEDLKFSGSSSKSSQAAQVPDTFLSTKTVNIVICHKQQHRTLDWDKVQNHIEEINNTWYQTLNPLLSDERRLQLEQAFGFEGSDSTTTTKDLPEAYQILFTQGERENLLYDHFLEDWEAYCETHSIDSPDKMSLDTALDFLQEMQ